MRYLSECSFCPVCSLHREIVEGLLLSIQRLSDNDAPHSFVYMKHTLAVSTCSKRDR